MCSMLFWLADFTNINNTNTQKAQIHVSLPYQATATAIVWRIFINMYKNIQNMLYIGLPPHAHRKMGRCKARRATARGPKGRRTRPRRGSWWGGSQPPPHQLGGLGEHCKLPQRGPGQSPGRNWILVKSEGKRSHLVTSMSLNFNFMLQFHHNFAY